MTERDGIVKAMETLESRRAALGDAVVDAALEALREQLARLDERSTTRGPAPAASAEDGAEKAPAASRDSSAERKLVTVLFADISGFTALSEKEDPETVRDLVNGCFDRLVPCIRRYDGTIDKFIGDEVMALFGAPAAHEDDPERALRAALAMQEALDGFNRSTGADLGIHFGINTGLVLAGDVGSKDRREYSAIGDAVNLASRLGDLSERGQILVGPDTWRHACALFDFEALPAASVKGKSEPVPVYLLKGERRSRGWTPAEGSSAPPSAVGEGAPRAGRGRGLETTGLHSPLVGREAECSALRAALKRLAEGLGGIIGILGEAGIGKSRLLAELRDGLPSGIRWLEGKALSYGAAISYYPFREIIRTFAGIEGDETDDSAWSRLERAVSTVLQASDIDYAPFIATALAIDVPADRAEKLRDVDEEAFGKRIFLSMRRLFERIAKLAPTVLVLDDIHWMDASSSALLEHILAVASEAPLLIVWLSRPDPDLPSERLRAACAERFRGLYREMRLAALSGTDSERLLANLLGTGGLAKSLRDAIAEKAEGNPYFVEEIVRTLLDARAIVRDPSAGHFRAAGPIDSVSIPDTLQGVIMARVDRLDERTKGVIRTASVIGRAFSYRILLRLCGPNGADELDAALAELQRVGLVREKQRQPELEFIFIHALAQEATYDSILLQRRRELHARVADALEGLYSDRLDEFYGQLAYHYARAEAWDKAQAYLVKAGDQAGRMAADSEALVHYTQAMDSYAKAFGDRWDPELRARLVGNIGEAFFRRGEVQKAEEYLAEALALLGFEIPKDAASLRSGLLRELALQARYRIQSALLGFRPPGEKAQAMELYYRYAESLGWIYNVTDQAKSLHMILSMANLAERLSHIDSMVECWAALGYVFDLYNLPRLGGHYLAIGERIVPRCSRSGGKALLYHALGHHFHAFGDWARAIGYYERSIILYEESGNLWGWGNVLCSPVALHRLRGDCAGQIPRLRAAVSICRDTGDPKGLVGLLQGLAHLLVYTGPAGEAIGVARECVELARAVKNRDQGTDATGDLGYALIRAGRLEEALAILESNLLVIETHRIGGTYPTQTLGALALAYLLMAEKAGSGPDSALWLKKASSACRKARGQGARDLTGLVRSMRYRARCEWLRGRRRAAMSWWRRASERARELGAPYETAMIALEMGRLTGDAAGLERAAALLEGMGATLDREDALEALGKIRERVAAASA